MPETHDAGRSPPGERELDEVLGRSSALWARLRADIASEFGPLAEKWSFSKTTQHWSLQLKQRKTKRTVLYLIVGQGHFLAAFALGEKACLAARRSGLAAPLLQLIEDAPRYPEGRGVRLEVRSRKDCESAKKLAAIKMAN